MGEAYAPSRFLWKILGRAHHNVMIQGPRQSSARPHPQGLRTASAHAGHAAGGDDQHTVKLQRCLLLKAGEQGPYVVRKSGH